MISDTPRPLPECALCSTPVQRRVHRTNRGTCTPCKRVTDAMNAGTQQLTLDLEPLPRQPDLTNVVVLDTRRRTR